MGASELNPREGLDFTTAGGLKEYISDFEKFFPNIINLQGQKLDSVSLLSIACAIVKKIESTPPRKHKISEINLIAARGIDFSDVEFFINQLKPLDIPLTIKLSANALEAKNDVKKTPLVDILCKGSKIKLVLSPKATVKPQAEIPKAKLDDSKRAPTLLSEEQVLALKSKKTTFSQVSKQPSPVPSLTEAVMATLAFTSADKLPKHATMDWTEDPLARPSKPSKTFVEVVMNDVPKEPVNPVAMNAVPAESVNAVVVNGAENGAGSHEGGTELSTHARLQQVFPVSVTDKVPSPSREAITETLPSIAAKSVAAVTEVVSSPTRNGVTEVSLNLVREDVVPKSTQDPIETVNSAGPADDWDMANDLLSPTGGDWEDAVIPSPINDEWEEVEPKKRAGATL